jgi:DNA repair protein RecN (Recombination protein N)
MRSEHLALLDRYAEDEAQRRAFSAEYQGLVMVRQELELLRRNERDAARRADLLVFTVKEIEAARLQSGEKAALQLERLRLGNAERLAQLAAEAVAALDESADLRPAAIERIGQAVHAVSELAKLDGSLSEMDSELQGLEDQAAETVRRLRRYRDSLECNQARLEQVEQRLNLIHDLERKYGDGEEAILAHLERARRWNRVDRPGRRPDRDPGTGRGRQAAAHRPPRYGTHGDEAGGRRPPERRD